MTRPTAGRTIFYGFTAGTLGVPCGHQILLALFHLAGLTARTPFDMTPTQPLGVPAWMSAMFFGGLWGIGLAMVLARTAPERFWWVALLFAFAPSAVAWTVVPLLKDLPVFFGGDVMVLVGSLAVNAAWSLTAAVVLRLTLFRGPGGTPAPA